MPIGTLSARHREILIRAIANVLESPIAQQTLAQIIDGLPLSDTAFDSTNGCLWIGHPLVENHKELCPGVIEETRHCALCSTLVLCLCLRKYGPAFKPSPFPADNPAPSSFVPTSLSPQGFQALPPG